MAEVDPRFPIGKFAARESYSTADLNELIQRIEALPAHIEEATRGLSSTQLDTPYREGGWTVRQVIHHVSDSHMNSYVRFKWTLTEDTPTIKAYNEKAWAQTPEVALDAKLSIDLLKALHVKWVALLKGMSPSDFGKQFVHPDSGKHIRLDTLVGLYAWHGEHHLAHITSLKKRMNW